MRLINEDTVMEIIERVTNEAVEKKQPKYLIQSRIIAEIAGLPTIEAITREQYHDMTERFFDEFEENGADEETLAKCIFIGLAFGKLELMLFGSKDGDSECG